MTLMMGFENLENATTLIAEVYPGLADNLGMLITIVQAVGIAFIVYVGYLIINAIYNWRNIKRIKNIEQEVTEINEKLDILLCKKPENKNRDKKKKSGKDN